MGDAVVVEGEEEEEEEELLPPNVLSDDLRKWPIAFTPAVVVPLRERAALAGLAEGCEVEAASAVLWKKRSEAKSISIFAWFETVQCGV